MTFLPWQSAWQHALYGPSGFYRRPAGPAAHFRTSVRACGLLAGAVSRLARSAGLRRVVDVGTGRGELLAALHQQQAALDRGDRLELVGLDVVERPPNLPGSVRWLRSPGGGDLPDDLSQHTNEALVLAHEWLDDVPTVVLQRDEVLRWREVQVHLDTGAERLGSLAAVDDEEWVERWWPLAEAAQPGHRVEVGAARDHAWAALTQHCSSAVLVAVDYCHMRADRPPHGTLLGYRDGAACPPMADGSCDVTAHVALDAVAAAGEAAGASATVLTTQRQALRALDVNATLPLASSAAANPAGYLQALSRASQAGELIDPHGLGGFGWLLQLGPRPAAASRNGPQAQTLARLAGCP